MKTAIKTAMKTAIYIVTNFDSNNGEVKMNKPVVFRSKKRAIEYVNQEMHTYYQLTGEFDTDWASVTNEKDSPQVIEGFVMGGVATFRQWNIFKVYK